MVPSWWRGHVSVIRTSTCPSPYMERRDSENMEWQHYTDLRSCCPCVWSCLLSSAFCSRQPLTLTSCWLCHEGVRRKVCTRSYTMFCYQCLTIVCPNKEWGSFSFKSKVRDAAVEAASRRCYSKHTVDSLDPTEWIKYRAAPSKMAPLVFKLLLRSTQADYARVTFKGIRWC